MPQSRPVRAGVAIGLVVAGVAALVVAWVLGDDFATPKPAPAWVRVATVVVVVLAALVWLRRNRSTDRAVPLTTFGAAGVALVLTVLAALGFVDQYSRGFPGRSTVLAALGGLAVTAGALLGLRTAGRWRRLPAIGAIVLVAALATPLVLVVPDARVDATTAAAAKVAAVPDMVSRVAWSAEVDGPVRNVVAAGAGVVLMVDDGVVALDGTTGRVRWTRVRHGAEAAQLDVSPDGATVLLQFRPRDRFPIRREIIDAVTGQVRFTVDNPNEGASTAFITPVTNTSYIGANDDETEFYGYSLTDGHRLWTYRAPDDCWLKPNHTAQVAAPAGMMLPLFCGKDWRDEGFTEFRYVMVDATTGAVRWEHSTRWDTPMSDVTVSAELAPDNRFVAVRMWSDTDLTPAAANAVLDTGTGKPLPTATPTRLRASGVGVVAQSDGGTHLVDVRTGKALSVTQEIQSCLASTFGAVLASGMVCVDPELDSFDEFVDSGRIELTVGTLADAALRPVPVTLGGPFDTWTRGGDHMIMVAAAPGAVVVTTGLVSVGDNGRIRVVGLR
jgi:outer membrane protein assembly factor BamB